MKLLLLIMLTSLTFAGQMITINKTDEVKTKLGLVSMKSHSEQTVCVATTLTSDDILKEIESFDITSIETEQHGNVKCFYMFRN